MKKQNKKKKLLSANMINVTTIYFIKLMVLNVNSRQCNNTRKKKEEILTKENVVKYQSKHITQNKQKPIYLNRIKSYRKTQKKKKREEIHKKLHRSEYKICQL